MWRRERRPTARPAAVVATEGRPRAAARRGRLGRPRHRRRAPRGAHPSMSSRPSRQRAFGAELAAENAVEERTPLEAHDLDPKAGGRIPDECQTGADALDL